jgi:hypothetical protein
MPWFRDTAALDRALDNTFTALRASDYATEVMDCMYGILYAKSTARQYPNSHVLAAYDGLGEFLDAYLADCDRRRCRGDVA